MKVLRRIRRVTGTVRSEAGEPIEGVMVIGADLGYVATGPDGSFAIINPEMALFFWRTGFRPQIHVLSADPRNIEITLQAMERSSKPDAVAH
jgi:hypothetical protein